MKKLPTARQNNLVIQQLDSELLVYDLETNKAFSLSETSALVFNACNGETTFDELKAKHNFTDDLIFLTLDELKKESLIADNSYRSPFTGISRREAAIKVGLATMLALPVILGVAAPAAAAAASCVPLDGACVLDNGRQSECCVGLRCVNLIQGCINCFPAGFEFGPFVPGSPDISQFANLCCGGATTSPIPGDLFGRVNVVCL